MASNAKKLILKSVNETHPNIEVTADEPFFLGRTPECAIADAMVSRKHINLVADFEKFRMKFKVLGVNPSALNGIVLETNKEHTAVDGDVLEVLPGKYLYKVCFEGGDTADAKNGTTPSKNVATPGKVKLPVKTDGTPEKNIKKSPEKKFNSSAKSVASPKNSPKNAEATKKRRLSNSDDQSTPNKRRKWTSDIFKDAKSPFAGDKKWVSYNKGQLVVFTAAGCQASNKIAAYDMDFTLIVTKSGKRFPVDADDWNIFSAAVPKILRDQVDGGYKIVVLTNQAGISRGKTQLVDIKTKLENISASLKLPLQAFIATGDSFFRKPLTGMWQALCDVANEGIEIDHEQSFYVGDAAGRPENKALKRKKDHSCVDRFLAMNVGLKFFTPEEHFQKAKPGTWTKPEFDPPTFISNVGQELDLTPFKLDGRSPEVIVMVGGPGSGKSFFARHVLASKQYEVVNQDELRTWQKCVNRVSDLLEAGKKVVVDNTNGTKDHRSRYINAAKKRKVPCRAFVMTTKHQHTLHNNAFRELTDPSHSKISDVVIHTYRKHFLRPEVNEGFQEVLNVDFIPKFENEKDRLLYGMYLLS